MLPGVCLCAGLLLPNLTVQIFFMRKSLLLFGTTMIFFLGVVFGRFSLRQQKSESKKVTGVGGIFFKCKDPEKLKAWYQKKLGLQTDKYGTNFVWYQGADSTRKGYTQWSLFKETTRYFTPSTKDFMINYRVENLATLVESLKKDSVTVLDKMEIYDYGKFIHILDPEGNKIELWEPVDAAYGSFPGGRTF